MWKVYVSRWANVTFFGGRPDEMISSRVHREKRWGWVTVIDFFWFCLFWRTRHCKQAYIWERRYNRETDQEATRSSQEEASSQPSAEG